MQGVVLFVLKIAGVCNLLLLLYCLLHAVYVNFITNCIAKLAYYCRTK